jgi:hypothetical protein
LAAEAFGEQRFRSGHVDGHTAAIGRVVIGDPEMLWLVDTEALGDAFERAAFTPK